MEKTAIIVLTLIITMFAQSVRFNADTVGFDLYSSTPRIAQLENRTGTELTIDSLSIDSIDNAAVQLRELMIQIHLGSGLFVKTKDDETIQTIAKTEVKPYGSEVVQVIRMQNKKEWQDFASNDLNEFSATLTIHSSEGDFPVVVNGIWVNESN